MASNPRERVTASNSVAISKDTTSTRPGHFLPGHFLPVQTTRPPILIRHDISDEELEMLKEGSRDGLSGALWAFAGAALSAIPPGGMAVYMAYVQDPPEPLTGLGLIEILLLFGCAILVIAIKFIAFGRVKRVKDLVGNIRSRPFS
jgi:hypothetical protein